MFSMLMISAGSGEDMVEIKASKAGQGAALGNFHLDPLHPFTASPVCFALQ